MAGSLEFIKSASGTSVTSLSITNVFSADYDVYKIIIKDLHSANQVNFNMRFIDSSDSIITATNYDIAQLIMYSHASFGEKRQTNVSEIELGYYDCDTSASGIGVVMYIFNPFSSSSYSFITEQNAFFEGLAGALDGGKSIAILKQTASMTGLNFFLDSSASISSLKVDCYGVK